jgi:hypothetical protein
VGAKSPRVRRWMAAGPQTSSVVWKTRNHGGRYVVDAGKPCERKFEHEWPGAPWPLNIRRSRGTELWGHSSDGSVAVTVETPQSAYTPAGGWTVTNPIARGQDGQRPKMDWSIDLLLGFPDQIVELVGGQAIAFPDNSKSSSSAKR